MNTVILMGRLTDEPKIHKTEKGVAANYSLAVDMSKEEVVFVKCVSFGKTAEFMEKWVHKGQRIAGSGELRQAHDKEGKTTGIEVCLHRAYFADGPRTAEEPK